MNLNRIGLTSRYTRKELDFVETACKAAWLAARKEGQKVAPINAKQFQKMAVLTLAQIEVDRYRKIMEEEKRGKQNVQQDVEGNDKGTEPQAVSGGEPQQETL